MYRLLLCYRYLRTRYVALASIVSVTLGVATLVVVNSVMAGFADQMQERLHGLVSDIVIERHASGGIPNPEAHLQEILRICGDQVAGHSATVHVPAMLNIEFNGQQIVRHVNFVGLDPESYNQVSDFGEFLLHPTHNRNLDFKLREDGYGPSKADFPESGWVYRRKRAAAMKTAFESIAAPAIESDANSDGPQIGLLPPDELLNGGDASASFDIATEAYPGIVLGISTATNPISGHGAGEKNHFYCRPGDDVRMTFPNAADNAKAIVQTFTVVDLYESGMSEYDGAFAFCQLDQLQDYRGMINPETEVRNVTTIQLRLTDGADLYAVRDLLRQRFPMHEFGYSIQTWRELQGPMVEMVRLQTTLLNTLLFLIITVAGFGILATFFMIVVEKTRDIGTLKALGASNRGVMSIFLWYGLLLGAVGCGAGLLGGLVFVRYINQIAASIEGFTGQELFDPTVYYFTDIPTSVQPLTLVWVTAGAMAIAILASVLPAIRAARMHPVQALRFN